MINMVLYFKRSISLNCDVKKMKNKISVKINLKLVVSNSFLIQKHKFKSK